MAVANTNGGRLVEPPAVRSCIARRRDDGAP